MILRFLSVISSPIIDTCCCIWSPFSFQRCYRRCKGQGFPWRRGASPRCRRASRRAIKMTTSPPTQSGEQLLWNQVEFSEKNYQEPFSSKWKSMQWHMPSLLYSDVNPESEMPSHLDLFLWFLMILCSFGMFEFAADLEISQFFCINTKVSACR